MSTEENILEQWMQGIIDDNTLLQVYPDINVKELRSVLRKQATLQLETTPSAALWEAVAERTIKQKQPTQPARSSWWIYALILFCGIAGYFLWQYFSGDQRVKTAPAATQYIAFNDQSEVQLSPGSTVYYDDEFNRSLRLEGQAWINVPVKGSFKVETPAGEINVLGTQFDIYAFEESFMYVQCFEGRVSVKSNTGEEVILAAGQSVRLINQQFKTRENTSDTRSSWLDGKQNYSSTPLRIVHQDLSRFYDVQLMTKTDETRAFTGSIPTDDLQKAVLYLRTATGLQYELDSAQKTITVQ